MLPRNSAGPGGKPHFRLQAEIAIYLLDQAQHALDLIADLRLHHKTMRIVLAELADTREAGKRA